MRTMDVKPNLREAIKYGFELFKSYPGGIIGFALIGIIFSIISFLIFALLFWSLFGSFSLFGKLFFGQIPYQIIPFSLFLMAFMSFIHAFFSGIYVGIDYYERSGQRDFGSFLSGLNAFKHISIVHQPFFLIWAIFFTLLLSFQGESLVEFFELFRGMSVAEFQNLDFDEIMRDNADLVHTFISTYYLVIFVNILLFSVFSYATILVQTKQYSGPQALKESVKLFTKYPLETLGMQLFVFATAWILSTILSLFVGWAANMGSDSLLLIFSFLSISISLAIYYVFPLGLYRQLFPVHEDEDMSGKIDEIGQND